MRRELNEKFRLFFPSLLVLIFFGQTANSLVLPYVIHGNDDRLEVYEASPAHQILAESVVAIMESKSITTNTTGDLRIAANIYGEEYQLCLSERFIEQPDAAYCSGFLVAENVIATAGHCVEDKDFCKDSKFVFDYMFDSKNRNPLVAKQSAVYSCNRVIFSKNDFHGSDYALVELDRPVVGRTPLAIAKKKPSVNESVFIIGNPVGLPAKVADGASVLSHHSGYYVTDLDAFSGNSGAAVFNESYEVAGILVRGDDDFVKKGGCYISNPCKGGSCQGEDVSNPGVLAKALSDHFAKKTASRTSH